MDFSLAQMEAFTATYESGSFKAAAEQLNKRRQVITKLVCSMEESFNITLFERKTRHLEPTEVARKLYPVMNRTLVNSGKVQSTIRRFERKETTRLSVGIDSMLVCPEVMACFRELLSASPELQLDIHTGSTTEMFDWLTEKKVEVALRFYPFSVEGEMVKITAFNFEMINIASSQLVNNGAVISEDEASQMAQVVPKFVYHYNHQKQHVFSDKPIISNNLQQTLSIVEEGMGWTVVPKFMVRDQLVNGTFASFTIEGASPIYWSAELIYLSEEDLSLAGDLLTQQLQNLSF
ncbi:LysR family transcriptional regulator [Vibrio sp. 10N.261.51.F12]|uniref:LysR family transcriptional regulator n=1 Tax=Vibrio sp. 10N.261.51.F12 TaxID=3229679 RepID=UPI00354E041E